MIPGGSFGGDRRPWEFCGSCESRILLHLPHSLCRGQLLEFCRQRLEKKKKRIGGRIFGAIRQHLPPFDDAPPRLFTNPNLALICVALQ